MSSARSFSSRSLSCLRAAISIRIPIVVNYRCRIVWPLALACAATRIVAAQSAYYNLDAGRPTRVEDALPTARGELEIQLLPLRAEWVGDGTQRFRVEPKLSYGVLPMTEIELRVPVMHIRAPGSTATTGIASAGVGALHAFNVETRWPALALAGEAVFAVGSLSAPAASYSIKALLSKTLRFGRIELNAGGGTWNVRPAPVVTGGTVCGDAPGVPPCLITDVPCDVTPAGIDARGPSFSCAPPASATSGAGAARLSGAHWTAALGIDHTLPLVSTLFVADVIVDRFAGLYSLDDWTAEIGLRRQIAPQLVADLGIGRRFAGMTQSTSVTAGVSFATPFRRWLSW